MEREVSVSSARTAGATSPRGGLAHTLLVASGCLLTSGFVLTSGGCQHSLFKRGVQRSQYETYDTMRNQHASDRYEDEFGRERINLRGRLLPQD